MIRKLLEVDPSKRFSAEQALKHQWFKIDIADYKPRSTILKRLSQFKGVSKLRKTALNLVVKMLKHSDIQELEREFKKIDTDQTGFISVEELSNAFKANDEMMSSA